MQAAAAARSNGDLFELSIWTVVMCSAIAEVAGAEGPASFSIPFCVLGLVALELRSLKLVASVVKFIALTLLFDIIFLATFAPARGQTATAFLALAWIAKLGVLVFGRKFLSEDLGGVLGIADPAPLVASEAAGASNEDGGQGADLRAQPSSSYPSSGNVGGPGGGATAAAQPSGGFQGGGGGYQSAL